MVLCTVLLLAFCYSSASEARRSFEKEPMNKFDIIILTVVGLSILLGMRKGLTRQVVGLIGVVGGYFIAMRFYESFVTKFLKGFSPTTGHIIAFLGIFVACIVAASIIGWIIGGLMNITGLGILNRIGGALLGGVKGCFIVAVAVVGLIAFLPRDNGAFKGSWTVRYIQPIAGAISTMAPKSIKTKYDQKAAKIGSVSDKGEWRR
jgi:membrane protein required for colicin V production